MNALIALTAEPARREAAVQALSAVPLHRVATLAESLRHPSSDVRQAVVEALGRMRQPEATRALASALDDTDRDVRLAAIRELKHLGSVAARPKLLSLARTDADADVRRAALLAVSRSGEADAAPASPR